LEKKTTKTSKTAEIFEITFGFSHGLFSAGNLVHSCAPAQREQM